MKKSILLFAFLGCFLAGKSQKVTTDAKGNYIAVKHTADTSKSIPTGKTFTNSKGEVFPVFTSANGKLFVNRVSKSGNSYKQYLKID